MKNLEPREIWFITGSQHLYGPGPLKQVAEDSKKIVEEQGGNIYLDGRCETGTLFKMTIPFANPDRRSPS